MGGLGRGRGRMSRIWRIRTLGELVGGYMGFRALREKVCASD